jgi:probable F420-dependent oxidoreductase
MRVYAGCDPRLPLQDLPDHARRVEAMGYDGLQVSETVHDALALALLALEHTDRLTVRTSVALAFVRSPTLVAYAAWDLSAFSGGRFELGLGTQIRQHIEDRFAMPWSDPAGRMADYLDALEALFAAFRTGQGIDHRGTHHRLTRLPPYFNPGPDPTTPTPPLWLGGVNPEMCRLAGARAAGFISHPSNSDPRYLAEQCRPALAEGAARAGRTIDDLELVVTATAITGATEAELAAERERQRRLLAFLFSTPAYAPTLELHGLADLGPDLRALTREDRWDDLSRVLTDEALDRLVPSATYDDLAEVLLDRYAGLADGLTVRPPTDPLDDEAAAAVVAALQKA